MKQPMEQRLKTVIGIHTNPSGHWVGNGFPVRSLFSYQELGRELSPFLLLDRAGPHQFEPSHAPRGVGVHPHRGFETVTLVYEGEVSHADSTGQGGTIGPGDVQWMTAGAGILHEEFHSPAFTRAGGTLDMVQLWVNLPARHKMEAPGYQAITDAQIPRMVSEDGTCSVRVVAGQYQGAKGPARTFSPLQVWDIRMQAGADMLVPAPSGWNTALVVLHGQVRVDGIHPAAEGHLVVLSAEGSDVPLRATADALVLVLQGEPLNEPIVGHGPFVMNTREEIIQAMTDFRSGRFGQM